MAKIVNLAEYQKSLSARLQKASTAPVVGAKLGLEFGGASYLVDVDGVGEVVPSLEITPVPFVQPWFLGIAEIRGTIYSVIDMGAFVGNNSGRDEAENYYVVSGSRFGLCTALRVRRVPGLRRTEEWRKFEPVPSVSSWITASYVDEREQPWHEIGWKELLGHPDFLQIAR